MKHKSGFVNIVGKPNVGKSTLVNGFIGEKLSIITAKPQTTRHRILAILNHDDYQIVFSDTPGMVEDPSYKMHEAMNKFVMATTEDADIFILLIDVYTSIDSSKLILPVLSKVTCPKYLVINKIDQSDPEKVTEIMNSWNQLHRFDRTFEISALRQINTQSLLDAILKDLPEGQAYYPKDQISDKSERFFVSEIIREKILENFKQEIPYSCEIFVEEYVESEKNGAPFAHILANIFVERKTQKSIIIGKGGASIKKIGSAARIDIEKFLGRKIYLELYVKVKEKWRNDEQLLRRFGYRS